jgi:NADH:ubiquinone oxidoreductase subunit D
MSDLTEILSVFPDLYHNDFHGYDVEITRIYNNGITYNVRVDRLYDFYANFTYDVNSKTSAVVSSYCCRYDSPYVLNVVRRASKRLVKSRNRRRKKSSV